MMSRVSFRKAFWGYDIEWVEQVIADKLRELEEGSQLIDIDEKQKQLENMLDFLKVKMKIAEQCRALVVRTGAYDHGFADRLINNAREKALAILAEAYNYAEARKVEETIVVRKIAEIEQTLAMLKRENSRILSSVPFEKILDRGKQADDVNAFINTQDDSGEEVFEDQSIRVSTADRNVLIVEDDKMVEHLLTSLLEREGFASVTARDGWCAMQLINEMAPPRVALLDIMLPYINGLQLLKYIRTKREWDRTAVIMLTDNVAEGDVIFAMKNGANDCIQKPFSPRELIARVNRFA
ncbi:MAG: putative response regulator, CheY [Firmicutes bacterium]|nr:putative response regulator, CheY [Bacillota bacterium]